VDRSAGQKHSWLYVVDELRGSGAGQHRTLRGCTSCAQSDPAVPKGHVEPASRALPLVEAEEAMTKKAIGDHFHWRRLGENLCANFQEDIFDILDYIELCLQGSMRETEKSRTSYRTVLNSFGATAGALVGKLCAKRNSALTETPKVRIRAQTPSRTQSEPSGGPFIPAVQPRHVARILMDSRVRNADPRVKLDW
jgi:hypothetical protein